MQFKNILTKSLSTLVLIISTAISVLAQGGPGDPVDINPDLPNGGVPLEGADILLLAMGAGFVIFKVWQHKHNKKTQAQGIQ
jgi:hypothetical protein